MGERTGAVAVAGTGVVGWGWGGCVGVGVSVNEGVVPYVGSSSRSMWSRA